MKVKLIFNLPHDQELYHAARRAPELLDTLQIIDTECRGHLKHDGKRTADELAEDIRRLCWEELSQH